MATPRSTERTWNGLFAQCCADLEGPRWQMGSGWGLIADSALDRVRAPGLKAALSSLMPRFGVPTIASSDLARIATPTALIWGRQDLQVPLRVAEDAIVRHAWPLRVIDNAGDDPALEQPEALMAALRPALEISTREGVSP